LAPSPPWKFFLGRNTLQDTAPEKEHGLRNSNVLFMMNNEEKQMHLGNLTGCD